MAAEPIPIALHGGTGLTDAQFSDLISRGCAKVNISTALKVAYMKSNLAFLRGALCLTSKYRRRSAACDRLPADGWAHHPYTTKAGPAFKPAARDDVTIGVLAGSLVSAVSAAVVLRARGRHHQRRLG